MKKKLILCSIILLVLILILFNAKNIFSYLSGRVLDFVSYQFYLEEKEREEKIANGELVRGKDTVIIWENTYEIFHSLDGNDLVIDTADEYGTILCRVRAQKVLNNKLYVVSDDGCAVIDKNKICRVFITNFNNKSADGTEVDSNGEKTYFPQKIESKDIKYLSDYSEFQVSEKEILNKLKNSK